MCKRNSPDKNEASSGCVRETPEIKMKQARDVYDKKRERERETTTKNKQKNDNGICKRNSVKKKKKKKKKKTSRDV